MSMPEVAPKLDPITLSVLWNAFVAITQEMGAAIRHTAVSTPVREGEDFSTGLFDANGRMIAQGDFSPGHLGSMPFAVKNALDYYRVESLRPGDGILMNDLYLGAGHLPDAFLISPIFLNERILGYGVNVAHHIDVGGVTPGSMGTEGIKEFYAEGIRLLPVKVFKGGELDEEIARIITANVRVPEAVLGDLKAQRNANRIGQVRLQELARKYGTEILSAAMTEVITKTGAIFREGIRALADGDYYFEDYMDDTGRGTKPVKIAVTVRIKGDELTADFAGTDSQTPSGMNSPLNYTRAYVLWAVKCVVAPHLPQNHGGIAPVHVVAPEGCYVNPSPPAAAGARAINNHRLTEVIFGALAQVAPDRVIAACSQMAHPIFSGIDPRTNRRFVSYDLIIGGWGARATKDGCEALTIPANARNIPIEVEESDYPLLFEHFEFVPDSAGVGRNRGGCAVRRDIRILADGVQLGNLTDRQKFAPFGLFGGGSGVKAATILNPGPDQEEFGAKEVRELKRGDLLSFMLAGGGGYGDPLERQPERVKRDVVAGYVSIEKAAADYGVILTEDHAVEKRATEATRSELRSARAARP
jgi:N-methylhydantoinase B